MWLSNLTTGENGLQLLIRRHYMNIHTYKCKFAHSSFIMLSDSCVERLSRNVEEDFGSCNQQVDSLLTTLEWLDD